jgi:hypothetical protein
MASVQQVYDILKNVVNKEQKGYITVEVFNTLAHVAQINVYNEFFEDLIDAKRISRQSFDPGRDKSVRKLALEDLSYMVKEEDISSNTNVFKRPADLSRIVSIRVKDSLSQQFSSSEKSRAMCEILYDVEKINAILGSNLSTPTESFPVALVSGDIEVFPSSINTISVTYYRTPGSYVISSGEASNLPPRYDVMAGEDIFNPLVSRDFMLPDHCIPELVAEMAKMLGMRLRDRDVFSYATQEESAE